MVVKLLNPVQELVDVTTVVDDLIGVSQALFATRLGGKGVGDVSIVHLVALFESLTANLIITIDNENMVHQRLLPCFY